MGDSSPRGLLVSQVGYDTVGAKRAVYRGPAGALPDDATFELRNETDGRLLTSGRVQPWGGCWHSHWWTLDFDTVQEPGPCRLLLRAGDQGVADELLHIGDDHLFQATWQAVALEQAERRQWLVSDRSGWYDAGTHWQEANSHAAYLFGLADLLQLRGPALGDEACARLVAQLRNGAEHLARLQDLAAERGLGDGALVHQSLQKFGHDTLVLPGDVAKAAAAWALVARALARHGVEAEAAAMQYRARAARALIWLQRPEPQPRLTFNHLAHGLPGPLALPQDLATPDLAMAVWAAALLGAAGMRGQSDAAAALARRWLARQVAPAADTGAASPGRWGHFRLYDDWTVATKAWTHGVCAGEGPPSSELGSTFGLNMLPLLELLRGSAGHPDAPLWQAALRAWAYGHFLPSCSGNPFGIAPYGDFGEQGLLHFAGLWHGCNAVYGLAATHALELAAHFDDPAFLPVATGNLQWIAGLNAGITAQAARAATICTVDVPAGVALSFSMIHGIGRRSAGSWLNIRGAICNGFATGRQFEWDVPPHAAADAPDAFTDEDWITHAGAWLSATARFRPTARPASAPHTP